MNNLWEFNLDHEPIYDPESPPILGFYENYKFLSNFHKCDIIYKGRSFTSSEQAYVWAKKLGGKEWYDEVISIDNPGRLKRLGRDIKLRPCWEYAKYSVMEEIVRCKFTQNPNLMELLLNTGSSYIEETNWWRDTFWGVCKGVGENNLGKILMLLRKEFNYVQRNISTV